MTLLAALLIAAASARVESVSLTTLDSRLAVRIVLTGTPGLVAGHREGDVARVAAMDAGRALRARVVGGGPRPRVPGRPPVLLDALGRLRSGSPGGDARQARPSGDRR